MPAPHQATPVAGAADDPVDIRSSVYQMLIGKDLQPFQAMGVIYSIMGEGGTGFNANAIGDNGRSHGWGQWNGGRFANLEATARSMGTTWNDPSAQLAHFANEINGPYAAEIERVKQATTTADATRLWTGSAAEGAGYERPAKNNYIERFARGSQAGRLDPKTGAPVWTAGPAAPAPAGAATGAPGEAAPAAPATSGAQDFAEAAKRGNVGGALAALTKGRDDEKGSKGPLGNLADQVGKAAPATSGHSQMLAPPVDTGQGAQAQAGQALLGQVLQQGAKPLSWSTQPYGYGMAGPQIPGTTLNSMGY